MCAAEILGQWIDALFERVTLICQGEFRPLRSDSLGNSREKAVDEPA